MQVRRTGFATEKVALTEYRRLCRQRDARHPQPRLSDTVQCICDGWVLAREQQLEPNTVHNYRWLLGLIYPHVGKVRASRLSARMVERAYRDLEAAGRVVWTKEIIEGQSPPCRAMTGFRGDQVAELVTTVFALLGEVWQPVRGRRRVLGLYRAVVLTLF